MGSIGEEGVKTMVYGWGKGSQQWTLSDGNTLVCVYRYFSLMWIFQVALKKTWLLQGNDRRLDAELTRDELVQRYGDEAPKLSVWRQYGLIIGIACLVLLAVVLNIF